MGTTSLSFDRRESGSSTAEQVAAPSLLARMGAGLTMTRRGDDAEPQLRFTVRGQRDPVGSILSPAHGSEEPEEWRVFLERLEAPPVALGRFHAGAFRALWKHLRVAIGPRLPLPQVAPDDEGALRLCWSRDQYYAELVLHRPDDQERCLHEWFFRDRVRDEHDGSKEPETGAPAVRFLRLLEDATAG